MRRSIVGSVLCAVLLAFNLAGCTADDVSELFHTVTFTMVDRDNNPLGNVMVYVGDSTIATDVTASDGTVSLVLPGTESVIFMKSGFESYAELNRDWSAIDARSINMDVRAPEAAVQPSGIVDVTVNGPANAGVLVDLRGQYFSTGQSLTLDGAGTGVASIGAFVDTYRVTVRPSDTTLGASSYFFGTGAPVTVTNGGTATRTVTVAEAAGNAVGQEFAVTATGGIAGGDMFIQGAVYGVAGFRQPLSFPGRSFPSVTSVSSETLTIPGVDSGLTAGTRSVLANSTDATGDYIIEHRLYTYDPASFASEPSAQTFTLIDHGLSGITPVNDATSVNVLPTFTSSVSNTNYSALTYFLADVYNANGGVQAYPYAEIRDYGKNASLQLPAVLQLAASTVVRLNIRAWKFDAGTDALDSWDYTEVRNGCFATGSTAPSVVTGGAICN